MAKWSPCKRRDFIRRLRQLGFEGPYAGSRHQFILFENNRLTIPTNAEYSVPQLRFMLKEAEAITGRKITLEAWNQL